LLAARVELNVSVVVQVQMPSKVATRADKDLRIPDENQFVDCTVGVVIASGSNSEYIRGRNGGVDCGEPHEFTGYVVMMTKISMACYLKLS
jgi:hypothetical protein